MNGLLIAVVGILAIYVVLSGKVDCLLASFRACSGSTAATETGAEKISAPVIKPPKSIIDDVLSNKPTITI